MWFYVGGLCVHPSVGPQVCPVHLLFDCPAVFFFLDGYLSKYQWIFTKFGMCIYIVGISFVIANRQILSIFDNYLPPRVRAGKGRVLWFHGLLFRTLLNF